MISTLADVEFRLLTIPASLDDAGADVEDFVDMVRIRNEVLREVSGHDDHRLTPAETLAHVQDDEDESHVAWLILVEGRAVGRAGADIPLEPGSKIAYVTVELLREAQGRGIATAAYALVESAVRARGRSVLQSWAEHPDAPGPRVEPPTGFGSVPADRTARFLIRHGYALEQIERCSALDLRDPWDHIERLAARARAAAAGYRIVSWLAPTPAEYVDGYAWMKSRMITDAPAAALEFDEEVWDAQRVARNDARYTSTGCTVRVVAAQHIESGELCAFNELEIGADLTAATHQFDTLVLAGHRGHRLGMLVKCENLLAWREVAPRSPRVITYNAEENRPMLDINEAIGFVPIAYEGAWKKVLA